MVIVTMESLPGIAGVIIGISPLDKADQIVHIHFRIRFSLCNLYRQPIISNWLLVFIAVTVRRDGTEIQAPVGQAARLGHQAFNGIHHNDFSGFFPQLFNLQFFCFISRSLNQPFK